MCIFFYLVVFIFGLVVGSFLNCVIYRLEKKESFLKGRSFCPHCKHTLCCWDLIPIFSFLILKGKCRYCQKKISWQYPLVEIATALLFLLIFNFSAFGGPAVGWQFYQNLLSIFYFLLAACFLLIIFVFDLKHFIIPDKVIFPAIAIAFLYRLFEVLKFGHWDLIGNWKLEIGNFLGAAFGAAIFFLIIVLVSRGKWMGLGDVKLAFFMGLFLGFPNIVVALFLAFLIGAIIGVGLILVKKKNLKSELPFGPFLVTGTFIALFWGQAIVYWYLNLFSII